MDFPALSFLKKFCLHFGRNTGDGFHANRPLCYVLQAYDLAYYFYVEDWVTYFLKFKWKNYYKKYVGFSVKTTKHFLNRNFCLDFARGILKASNSSTVYCGMTVTQFARELYAHAASFYHFTFVDKITNGLTNVYGSGEFIDVAEGDNRGWYYSLVWNGAGPVLDMYYTGDLFKRDSLYL